MFDPISSASESLIKTEVTPARLETRMRAFTVKWNKYQDNHATLWRTGYAGKPDARIILEAHPYFKEKLFRNCEEIYLEIMEKMLSLKNQTDAAAATGQDNHNLSLATQGAAAIHCDGLRLPK